MINDFTIGMNTEKWANDVIQNALILATTTGNGSTTFKDYLVKAINSVIQQIAVKVKAEIDRGILDDHLMEIRTSYEKGLAEGIKTSKSYDLAYKVGLAEGLRQAEESKRWDNLSPDFK